MAIDHKTHSQAAVSGVFETKEASIALTPAMFELLSAGIYEDRILAIVRELTCNSRDAMKEHAMNLGVDLSTLPTLEVHAPNVFEPFFFVRDYGTGLTHEQIFDIYLSYGTSTKTGSNDFIGMFGIGSKSPLAYTDSFIVTSYTNGTEIQYNIYKDAGIPKITKLIERPTTEANGLKVQVSVRKDDFYNFNSRIGVFMKLFNFPVNITGAEVNTEVTFVERNSEYEIVEGYESGCFAMMGGVPYRLSNAVRESLRRVIPVNTLLLPFDIGALNIASSRESLSFVDGDATDLAIKARVDSIKASYFLNMQNDIDTCDNIKAVFVKLYDKYNMIRSGYSTSRFSYPEMEFKGETLNELVDRFDDGLVYRTFYKARYGAAKSKELGYKGTKGFGFFRDENNVHDFVIFINDKKTGGVKCARAYATEEDKTVIFEPTPEALAAITEVYGKIDTVICSDIYDKYCPKVERVKSTVVKVSGVFKRTASVHHIGGYQTKEVKTVDGTETGYYVPMVRDDVSLDEGLPTASTFNRYSLHNLVDYGLLPELYFIRKSSAKKNRPAGLELLTTAKVKELITKAIDKKALKRLAYYRVRETVESVHFNKHFKRFEDDILKSYPTVRFYSTLALNKKQCNDNAQVFMNIATSLNLTIDFRTKIDKMFVRGVNRFREEKAALQLKYKFLFDAQRAYQFDSVSYQQLGEFVQAKVDGIL